MNDILGVKIDKAKVCVGDTVCHPLQGKSLAQIVLGSEKWKQVENSRLSGGKKKKKSKSGARKLRGSEPETAAEYLHEVEETDENGDEEADKLAVWTERAAELDSIDWPISNTTRRAISHLSGISTSSRALSTLETPVTVTAAMSSDSVMSTPKLEIPFALTQSWRCASKPHVMESKNNPQVRAQRGHRMGNMWVDCDKTKNPTDEISIMGYSMRTSEFRYTAWFHYNRHLCVPILDVAPFDEEVSPFQSWS